MSKLKIEDFGNVKGQQAHLFKIEFKGKLKVEVTNYGCIVRTLEIPDRKGKLEDVVLGYDKLEQYLKNIPYFGAVIGRYSGRIENGEFSIDGKKYKVARNNGDNHLHGGKIGFDKVIWEAEAIENEDSVILKFKYTSSDGEENYPGELKTQVTYTFRENEFRINYRATTDKPTIINLTQHTYFNLSACQEDILDHELQLNASKYVPINSSSIPTGELNNVTGTPFDFTKSKQIGKDIFQDNMQLKFGNGYDHSWKIKEKTDQKTNYAGKLYHSKSGRLIEFHSSVPGVTVYTSNFLHDQFIGKNKIAYQKHFGVCLETQYFPNSPNQPNFPSPILSPKETFDSTTIFRFSIV